MGRDIAMCMQCCLELGLVRNFNRSAIKSGKDAREVIRLDRELEHLFWAKGRIVTMRLNQLLHLKSVLAHLYVVPAFGNQ